MSTLAHQRCFNHGVREAVARCPECRRHFCRECITEHDDRMVCTACLAALARRPLSQRLRFAGFLRMAQCAFGFLLVWYCFFLLGTLLVKIPAKFHEGTIWRVNWLDKE